jgi:hypothetical protein
MLKIATDRTLTTVENTIGQIFHCQQATLIQGLLADSLDAVSAKTNDAELLSN